jgi:hypothetical protein
MASALATQLEVANQRVIGEHHRIGAERPDLGNPEGQRVNPARQATSPG